MCKMMINTNKDLKIAIYDLIFFEMGGIFKIEEIISLLSKQNNVNISKDRVSEILTEWIDNGLIYTDINGYITNSYNSL